jgi:hypothetical protein
MSPASCRWNVPGDAVGPQKSVPVLLDSAITLSMVTESLRVSLTKFYGPSSRGAGIVRGECSEPA